MEIEVRQAGENDLDSINDLTDEMHNGLAGLYNLDLSPEDLKDEHYCKGDLEKTYVAVDALGRIVGYMSFAREEDEWTGPHYELEHIVVDERHKGLGVGRELFKFLQDRAEREGMNVTAGTLERSKKTLEFYEKLGFKPYSVRMVLDLQKRLFKD